MVLVSRPIVALLFALVLAAALLPAACSDAQTAPPGGPAGTPLDPAPATSGDDTMAGDAEIVIAVLQIVSQPTLDAVVEGFTEALRTAGYREPRARLELHSAQGDEDRAREIAEELDEDQVDLVFAVSEPAAQAAAEALHEVPVVFAAVTDPVASGLVREPPVAGSNVTGVSDMWPVRPHLELFQQVVPGGHTIGLIYNPTEAESLAVARAERQAAAEMGLRTVSATVRHSSEVLAAAESLVGRVEAISVLRDSTVVSALESVVKVCTDNQIPLLAGDSDSVERGAVAAWTFDYKEHGLQAGRLAVRILQGAEPSDLGVEKTEVLNLAINESAAVAMGVTLPPELKSRAAQVY